MLNTSPDYKAGNDPHDHLRPASAIVSAAAAPSPVARLANHAKSFALTPGFYWKLKLEYGTSSPAGVPVSSPSSTSTPYPTSSAARKKRPIKAKKTR